MQPTQRQLGRVPTGSTSQRRPAQCRKWRIPVNTMAMPAASAAAITSSSRTEPPGWMTAVAPARGCLEPVGEREERVRGDDRAAGRRLGSRGLGGVSAAFCAAMRALSTRLIWPAPMPTVAPPLRNDGVRLDVLGHRVQANSRSAISASLGARLVTTLSSSRVDASRCRAPGRGSRRRSSDVSSPPSDRAARRRAAGADPSCAARSLAASGSASGAMITSMKICAIASAVAASIGRFTATMPPKALDRVAGERLW